MIDAVWRGAIAGVLAVLVAAPATAMPKPNPEPPDPTATVAPKPAPKPTASPIPGGPPGSGKPDRVVPTPSPAPSAAAIVFLPALPLSAKRSSSIKGTGAQMDTDVTIDGSGRLAMTTKTHEMTQLTGCSCTVMVLLADDQRVLWETSLKVYVVASKFESAITGTPSDRTDTWTEKIPVDRLARVKQIAIVHAAIPWSAGNGSPGGAAVKITHLVSLIPGVGAAIGNMNNNVALGQSTDDGAIAPYAFEATRLLETTTGSCTSPLSDQFVIMMMKALGSCR